MRWSDPSDGIWKRVSISRISSTGLHGPLKRSGVLDLDGISIRGGSPAHERKEKAAAVPG